MLFFLKKSKAQGSPNQANQKNIETMTCTVELEKKTVQEIIKISYIFFNLVHVVCIVNYIFFLFLDTASYRTFQYFRKLQKTTNQFH